jgi:hypothetical protein
MRVDETALWILLAICSVAGAGYAVARERGSDWIVVTALTGAGAGMAVAALVLLAAALLARV